MLNESSISNVKMGNDRIFVWVLQPCKAIQKLCTIGKQNWIIKYIDIGPNYLIV